MEQGLIHIYCGDGKGKTSAAVGLSIRAAGAGLKVLFCQFMKKGDSSELEVLERERNIDTLLARNSFGFTWTMTEEQKQQLTSVNDEVLAKISGFIKEKNYDVIVMDEIISAYNYSLLNRDSLMKILDRHECVELVLTGRNPEDDVIKYADYISEIKSVRHPYEKGIKAREGIEW